MMIDGITDQLKRKLGAEEEELRGPCWTKRCCVCEASVSVPIPAVHARRTHVRRRNGPTKIGKRHAIS